jgi:hypothetical protein
MAMDGARITAKRTLAEALERAWAGCRGRLEAAGGLLTAEIAEKAPLAAAVHMAEAARRAAAAPLSGRGRA